MELPLKSSGWFLYDGKISLKSVKTIHNEDIKIDFFFSVCKSLTFASVKVLIIHKCIWLAFSFSFYITFQARTY